MTEIQINQLKKFYYMLMDRTIEVRIPNFNDLPHEFGNKKDYYETEFAGHEFDKFIEYITKFFDPKEKIKIAHFELHNKLRKAQIDSQILLKKDFDTELPSRTWYLMKTTKKVEVQIFIKGYIKYNMIFNEKK